MTFIIALALAPLIVLTFCFAVEVLAGIRPLQIERLSGANSATAVVVVPAHNEQSILARRLEGLKEAAEGRARILVVADNCTDSTAEIARRLGAEVIERFDSEHRGKGFALDFARRHLEADRPDVVVIIDADCCTDSHSLELLIAWCAAAGRPCQATNLQFPSPRGAPAVQLSTFAFYIKNVVRQRALQRLAGRVHLLGTGMALPWPIFARADLATDNIVEDLKLGLDLANAGHAPLFVEPASVWSDAESQENTLSQRERWEGGFIQNALRVGPGLLARALRRGDARAVWAAINLLIPPFALLFLIDLSALVTAGPIGWITGAEVWPVLLLGSALLLAIIALLLAWRAGGSRFVTPGVLARVPLYLLWKVPLYLGVARRGAPKEWVRTRRGEL